MIIQIRGTSGSGKTTVMREVMKRLGPLKPILEKGRVKPLYYWSEPNGVAVLGHYESACGGCDNVGSAAAVNELIGKVETAHCSVAFDESGEEVLTLPRILCEGLLLSEDAKWTSGMTDVRVIFLTTPIETCISQVKSRREEAGNVKPLNEENTRKRVAVIDRARVKLTERGVRCVRCSSNQASDLIMKWLSCTPT